MLKRLIVLAALFGALPASAVEVRLNLGADLWGSHGYYWNPGYRAYFYDGYYNGVVSGTVSVGANLNEKFELGGRVGLMLITAPLVLGVPADFYVRFIPTRRLYLDGMVGPWFVLAQRPLRAHVGFGFGYRGDAVHIGLEAAYLEPAPMLGVRLGIPL